MAAINCSATARFAMRERCATGAPYARGWEDGHEKRLGVQQRGGHRIVAHPSQLFGAPNAIDLADPPSNTWQLNGGPASAGMASVSTASTAEAIRSFPHDYLLSELSFHC
jgi:hypothetical protein